MRMFSFASVIMALWLSAMSTANAQQVSYTLDDASLINTCLHSVEDQSRTDVANTKPGRFLEIKTRRDCIGVVQIACQNETPENLTTFGMVGCAHREISWWDATLNADYDRLRDALSVQLFSELQQVQRDWITYRDAKCSFSHSFWQDGSIRHLFFTSCQLYATADRALELQDILNWMDMN